MTSAPSPDGSTSVRDALESLAATVEQKNATAEIYDDGSQMTPMLVVEFGRTTERADVLRPLFQAEGPVAVDSVHPHRVVVREA